MGSRAPASAGCRRGCVGRSCIRVERGLWLALQRTVVPLRSEQAVHHDDRRPCNGRLIRRIVAVESQLDYIASYATARERPARHARGHRLKSPDARDVHFGRDRKGDTKDERGKE